MARFSTLLQSGHYGNDFVLPKPLFNSEGFNLAQKHKTRNLDVRTFDVGVKNNDGGSHTLELKEVNLVMLTEVDPVYFAMRLLMPGYVCVPPAVMFGNCFGKCSSTYIPLACCFSFDTSI